MVDLNCEYLCKNDIDCVYGGFCGSDSCNECDVYGAVKRSEGEGQGLVGDLNG